MEVLVPEVELLLELLDDVRDELPRPWWLPAGCVLILSLSNQRPKFELPTLTEGPNTCKLQWLSWIYPPLPTGPFSDSRNFQNASRAAGL